MAVLVVPAVLEDGLVQGGGQFAVHRACKRKSDAPLKLAKFEIGFFSTCQELQQKDEELLRHSISVDVSIERHCTVQVVV